MRLLISGYYGFGNVGDEAILAGILEALRHAAGAEPAAASAASAEASVELIAAGGASGKACAGLNVAGIEPVVLSGEPAATRLLHGVKAISRSDPRAVWRALSKADLLISGGGGLIQDRTSARSSLYYLGVIEMAHRAGVPVYVYSQGVGPLRRAWLRKTAGAALKRVRGAGVRDEASRVLLQELGVPSERIAVTADPAFALRPPSPGEREQALAGAGIVRGTQPLIGVVWRRPFSEDGVDPSRCREAAGRAVGRFARQLGAKVVVLPFQPSMDQEEARLLARVAGATGADVTVVDGTGGALDAGVSSEAGEGRDSGAKGDTGIDPRGYLALVGSMDLVVCVRFHGLVFAALTGTPAVGIAYDPKVRHLAETLQVPWMAPTNDLPQLPDALTRAWQKRVSLSQALLARTRELRTCAYAEGKRALSMAGMRGKPGSV